MYVTVSAKRTSSSRESQWKAHLWYIKCTKDSGCSRSHTEATSLCSGLISKISHITSCHLLWASPWDRHFPHQSDPIALLHDSLCTVHTCLWCVCPILGFHYLFACLLFVERVWNFHFSATPACHTIPDVQNTFYKGLLCTYLTWHFHFLLIKVCLSHHCVLSAHGIGQHLHPRPTAKHFHGRSLWPAMGEKSL